MATRFDTIRGFDASDVIDLSAIDANENAAGNQAFRFLWDGTFDHRAGDLVTSVKGPSTARVTTVSADSDGDAIADFYLEIAGAVTLSKMDFIL